MPNTTRTNYVRRRRGLAIGRCTALADLAAGVIAATAPEAIGTHPEFRAGVTQGYLQVALGAPLTDPRRAVSRHIQEEIPMSNQINDVAILVLQRGWVAVGEIARDGNEMVLSNAAIVRRWGTTKGLPQLAAEGPRENTVLDGRATIRVHELAVVMRIDADPAKWGVLHVGR